MTDPLIPSRYFSSTLSPVSDNSTNELAARSNKRGPEPQQSVNPMAAKRARLALNTDSESRLSIGGTTSFAHAPSITQPHSIKPELASNLEKQQANLRHATWLNDLTLDDLNKAAHGLRGRSRARKNCVTLAKDMLEYFKTEKQPTLSVTRANSPQDIGVELEKQQQPVVKEEFWKEQEIHRLATGSSLEITQSRVVQSRLYDDLLPADPLHSILRSDGIHEVLDHTGVDLTGFTQKRAKADQVITTLKSLALYSSNKGNSKTIYGLINLQSPKSKVGHQVVYLARPDQVWFIDSQRIQGGKGQAVSDSLIESQFSGPDADLNQFQRTVFLIPIHPLGSAEWLRLDTHLQEPDIPQIAESANERAPIANELNFTAVASRQASKMVSGLREQIHISSASSSALSSEAWPIPDAQLYIPRIPNTSDTAITHSSSIGKSNLPAVASRQASKTIRRLREQMNTSSDASSAESESTEVQKRQTEQGIGINSISHSAHQKSLGEEKQDGEHVNLYAKYSDDIKAMNNLTAPNSLDLSGCERITDAELLALNNLNALKSLNLSGCCNITDAGLLALNNLTALESLNLSHCSRLTDAGLLALNNLTALESLDLAWCHNITDGGLYHLNSLTTLQSLNLSGCDNITDAGLDHLSSLTTLQSLDLSYCERVTNLQQTQRVFGQSNRLARDAVNGEATDIGQINALGQTHGFGIRTWQNEPGKKYTGNFRNGQIDGFGYSEFANGGRFEGTYVNGQANGPGKQFLANGSRFEGTYVDDRWTGPGKQFYANGDRFEGTYVDGRRNGPGKQFHANGDRFEGTYVDGRRNGTGKQIFANGDRFEGTYIDGRRNGTGKEFSADGDRFEGTYVDGRRNGPGKEFRANGDRIEGMYVDGELHGQATKFHLDGRQAQCNFVNV
jgi:Sec-independent protein translocase protein TatA